MTEARRPVSLLVALAGGLAFAAALAFCAVSFAGPFGRVAPRESGVLMPAAVDLGLFAAFALHHSWFARFGIKQAVRRALPPGLERSFYVWTSSALLALTCAWWQPVAGVLWSLTGWTATAMTAVQVGAIGWTLNAARRLDVFELAGIRQAAGGGDGPAPLLDTGGPYRVVRHPIYMGWLALVWLPPQMTGTRLVFAAASTAYLIAAVPLEERDLGRTFGAAYDAYRARVRWRMVPFVY